MENSFKANTLPQKSSKIPNILVNFLRQAGLALTALFIFCSVVKVQAQKPNTSFHISTWNIQKGQNKNWWTYIANSPEVNYWAIQEATSSPSIVQFFTNYYFTDYNPAWTNSQQSTGTLSASTVEPSQVFKVITRVKEPISNTPKSFLVRDVDYACDYPIRVINVHMINFLLGSAYQQQLNQMTDFIQRYDGPIVVVGDFNNWNWLRTDTLLKWSKNMGLKLALGKGQSMQGLDHIFYKNLSLQNMYSASVKLSDHEPVHGIFSCKAKAVTSKLNSLGVL